MRSVVLPRLRQEDMETDSREDRSLMVQLESILDEELYRLKRLPDDPLDRDGRDC